MKNSSITPALSAVEKAIAAHETLVEERAAAERAVAAKIAAEQAAAAAKLQPRLEAAQALRDKLVSARTRRSELIEKIQLATLQLDYQKTKSARLDELIESTFGLYAPNRTSPDYAACMFTLPQHREERYAELILPRLEKWLTARRDDLAEVEKELAKLAAEAE